MLRPRAVLPWLMLGIALLVSGCVVEPAYPPYRYAPAPYYYGGGGYYYGGYGGGWHR